MSKWTPGPWSAEGRGPGLTMVFVGTEEGNRNATCALMDGTDEEREANARLIAAAPALLEALQRASQALAAISGGSDNNVIRARAAIAKATGESS